MGFFSEIASEARRSGRAAATSQPAEPKPEPAPTALEPTPAPEQPPEPSAHTPPPPEVKLAVEDVAPDDDARRKAHEAAEAKRKAEFDAKQAEKKAARQAALDRIAAMNRAELLAASVERVAADTERLTRRNMKEAVAEHIQAKCREDAAFAMLVVDPAKSMINCFLYINRRAREYAEQEMKDNGIQRTGVYGLDVPDGLCFQWAEDFSTTLTPRRITKMMKNSYPSRMYLLPLPVRRPRARQPKSRLLRRSPKPKSRRMPVWSKSA